MSTLPPGPDGISNATSTEAPPESFAPTGSAAMAQQIAALTAELERVRGERDNHKTMRALYFGMVNQLDDNRKELEAKLAAAETRFEGHGKPCYYCHELTSDLSANPGKWSLGLCHADEPGVLKWHHEECVNARLRERDALREQVARLRDRFTAASAYVMEFAAKVPHENRVALVYLSEQLRSEAIDAALAETQKEPSPK